MQNHAKLYLTFEMTGLEYGLVKNTYSSPKFVDENNAVSIVISQRACGWWKQVISR